MYNYICMDIHMISIGKMAKKKKQGHFCRICAERKSNEAFSGKGHAKHICKECDALPQERKNELQIINRIGRAGEKYPKARQDWVVLEKYAKSNKYHQAKEFALFFLEMSGRRLPAQTSGTGKTGFQDAALLSRLDNEIRDDIVAEMYEQIINYMYQREKLPDEEQKRETLDKVCNVLFLEYKEVLTCNNELAMLYDQTMREVIRDIENDEL